MVIAVTDAAGEEWYHVADGRQLLGSRSDPTAHGTSPRPMSLTVAILWMITNTDAAPLADDYSFDDYRTKLSRTANCRRPASPSARFRIAMNSRPAGWVLDSARTTSCATPRQSGGRVPRTPGRRSSLAPFLAFRLLFLDRTPTCGRGGDTEVPQRVISLATELVKLPGHLGIHSGGMVLTSAPVGQAVPIEHARTEKRTVLQ